MHTGFNIQTWHTDAQGQRVAADVVWESLPDGHRVLTVSVPKQFTAVTTVVEVRWPLRDIHQVFVPVLMEGLGQKQWVHLPWSVEQTVSTHAGLPFLSLASRHGQNRLFLGALDQVADAVVSFQLEYPHDSARPQLRNGIVRYERRWLEPPRVDAIRLFVSEKATGWEDVIQDYTGWHDTTLGVELPAVPPAAFAPVWCSWYVHLEKGTQADISRNLPHLRELGIGVVIIDSGWTQTATQVIPDTAGDLEVDEQKFPDLRGLIREIRAAGLRAMLWHAPFFVGRQARCRERLRSMLGHLDGVELNSLDPRLAATRQHLAETVATLMRRYELDGLKLDFIDPAVEGFRICPTRLDTRPGVEYETLSVATGTANCLATMADAIRAVRPDALIEFRQNYSNLATRPYATAFRTQDSPFDPEHIRHLVALLRLMCPGIPIHADPATWVAEESLVDVARWLASICLFSVPTYSMDWDRVPAEHRRLVRWWNDWYQAHRDDIHQSRLRLLSDDPRLNCLALISPRRVIAGLFAKQPPAPVRLTGISPRPLTLFNGTAEQALTLELPGWQECQYQTRDLNGQPVASGNFAESGIIEVPLAGMCELVPQGGSDT